MVSFDLVQVPRDPESALAYVERYKSFRLLALKTSPEAFGSTYAREAAFTDDVWHNRLMNPAAATFFAQQDGRLLSTITILGPLPFGVDELPPVGKLVFSPFCVALATIF
jgi:hypothetical protein